jgi:hypothetical protein
MNSLQRSLCFAFFIGLSMANFANAEKLKKATQYPPGEIAFELEFSNRSIGQAGAHADPNNDTYSDKGAFAQLKFASLIKTKCPDCKITMMKDKYKVDKFSVQHPEGAVFEITLDPGIIEVVSRPLSLRKLEASTAILQSLIWDTAAEMGLKPDTAGHLNFGLDKTIGSDVKLLSRFMSDYFNHTELTEGVLGYLDIQNAPHPERLELEQRQKLKQILSADYSAKADPINELVQDILKGVYFKSTTWGAADGEPAEKYHSFNITSIYKGSAWPRMELRAAPMTKTAEDLFLLSKLFLARVQFLKKNPNYDTSYVADINFVTKKTPDKKVEMFYQYVTETGGDWNDYRHLLAQAKKSAPALLRFERKRGLNIKYRCEAVFH